jgi:hypothetical protein
MGQEIQEERKLARRDAVSPSHITKYGKVKLLENIFFLDFLSREDGTDTLYRNVAK